MILAMNPYEKYGKLDMPIKRKRVLQWSLIMVALSVMAGEAWAQQPLNPRPDAGKLLRQYEVRPTDLPDRRELQTVLPKVPAGPAFGDGDVKVFPSRFRLSGVTLVDEKELQKVLEPLVGKLAGFAQLQYAADLVTAHYRAKGFITSRAYLPQQTLSAAGDPTEVEIVVLEGRYGKIRIENKSRVKDEVLRGLMPIREGEPVRLAPVERGLLLIEDLPGATIVSSTFSPGKSLGESEYILAVGAEPEVSGQVTADNFGLRSTGRERAGVQASWSSPRGVGDALDAGLTSSGSGLVSGRVAYSLPVGPNGLRASVSLSRVQYQLGEEFSSTDAHGTADVLGAGLSYPLVRERSLNVTAMLGLDSKKLNDATVFGDQRKSAKAITLGLNGDEVDGVGGGGTTAWSYQATFGKLRMDNDFARLNDVAGTEGNYSRYNVSLSRLQNVAQWGRGLTLQTSIRSQYAADNLESSEKMPIGGPSAVRAYAADEAAGDRAWLVNVELRQRFSWVSGWNQWVSAFYDAGGAQLNAKPLTADGNKRFLRGYGVGFGMDYNSRYFLNVALAQPSGDRSLDSVEAGKNVRVWLQAGANY